MAAAELCRCSRAVLYNVVTNRGILAILLWVFLQGCHVCVEDVSRTIPGQALCDLVKYAHKSQGKHLSHQHEHEGAG